MVRKGYSVCTIFTALLCVECWLSLGILNQSLVIYFCTEQTLDLDSEDDHDPCECVEFSICSLSIL